MNDDEENVVGQVAAPHIAGHCHRAHSKVTRDLSVATHQNPFLLLSSLCRVACWLQSNSMRVLQSNNSVHGFPAARPPLCSGCGSCQSLVRRITPRFMEELLRTAAEQHSTMYNMQEEEDEEEDYGNTATAIFCTLSAERSVPCTSPVCSVPCVSPVCKLHGGGACE